MWNGSSWCLQSHIWGHAKDLNWPESWYQRICPPQSEDAIVIGGHAFKIQVQQRESWYLDSWSSSRAVKVACISKYCRDKVAWGLHLQRLNGANKP